MTDARIPSEIPARLKARHAEAQRHYHSWAHIEALLTWLQEVSAQLHDPQAVELAILYHDAVYDPRSKENEARSAELMRSELEEHLPAKTVDRVETLILATAGHELPETSDAQLLSDCAFFLDIDLSILGTEPEVFEAYEEAIRKEYAFVPPADYCRGRSAILRNFLARDRLYFTAHFRDRLEAQARVNLRRSLTRLGGP